MTLCDRGGGRAERYVTPKKNFYMYNKYHIIICIIVYVLLTDFRFVGPTDERYVTGGGGRAGVTLKKSVT